MTIHALFFGHYRDILRATGTSGSSLSIEMPSGALARDLAHVLEQRDAGWSDLLARCRIAVGEEFVTPDTPLCDGDQVAFLPPMSGG